jgi:hypothetical protein
VEVLTGANAAASRESLRGLDVREAEKHSGMGEAAAVSCYTNVSSVDCLRGSSILSRTREHQSPRP